MKKFDSLVVQELTDTELAQIMLDGKGGMPSLRVHSARIRFKHW